MEDALFPARLPLAVAAEKLVVQGLVFPAQGAFHPWVPHQLEHSELYRPVEVLSAGRSSSVAARWAAVRLELPASEPSDSLASLLLQAPLGLMLKALPEARSLSVLLHASPEEQAAVP